MAADQVQEKPKEPEAKASDAAAGKAAEAPQSQQEKDAVGAQAKLSDEASGKPADAQNSTDAAGTATKDASDTTDTAETGEALTPWQKELQDLQKEREELDRKMKSGELDANGVERHKQLEAGFKSMDAARAAGMSEAQIRAQFGNLVLEDKGSRSIELDGKASGRDKSTEGNFSLTMDGNQLVKFDDASWGISKDSSASASIKVTLPESAASVENAHGKMSVVPGADGTNARIIEMKDGTVLVNRGDEYVAMKPGTMGFGQQVLEGAEAKKLFEAEETKYDGVETTNAGGKISVSSNGVNLVNVAMGQRPDIQAPESAQVMAQNEHGKLMKLDDGTQMITGPDSTAMIRSANGDVVKVDSSGQITEMKAANGDATEAWNSEYKKFESDVKVAGSDGGSLFGDDSWGALYLGKFEGGRLDNYNFAFAADFSAFDDSSLYLGANTNPFDMKVDPASDLDAAKSGFSFASLGKGISDIWNSDYNPLNLKWTDSLMSSLDFDWDGVLKDTGAERSIDCNHEVKEATGRTPEELRELAVNGDIIKPGDQGASGKTLGKSTLEVNGKQVEFNGEKGNVRVLEDGTRLAYNKDGGYTLVTVPGEGENSKGRVFKIYDGQDGGVEKVSELTDEGVIETINGKFDGFDSLTQRVSKLDYDSEADAKFHEQYQNTIAGYADGTVSMGTDGGRLVVRPDGTFERITDSGQTILKSVPHPNSSFQGPNHRQRSFMISRDGGKTFSEATPEEARAMMPRGEWGKVRALTQVGDQLRAQNTMGPFLPGHEPDAGPASDGPVQVGLNRLRIMAGRLSVDQTTTDGNTTAGVVVGGRDGPRMTDGRRITTVNPHTGVVTEQRAAVANDPMSAPEEGPPVSTWDTNKHTYEDDVFKYNMFANPGDPTGGLIYKPDNLLFGNNNDIFWDQNGDGDFFDQGALYDYDDVSGFGSWGDTAATWGTMDYDGYSAGSYFSPGSAEYKAAETEGYSAIGTANTAFSAVLAKVAIGEPTAISGMKGVVMSGMGELDAAMALCAQTGNSGMLAMLSMQKGMLGSACNMITQSESIQDKFSKLVGPGHGYDLTNAIRNGSRTFAVSEWTAMAEALRHSDPKHSLVERVLGKQGSDSQTA